MPYQPPSLVMRQGPQPNRPFPLSKDVITIGRSPDSDIFIDDAEVSRHHARLTRQGNNWLLEDLGSRNGTFVNGQRISGPVVLTPGARVDFGPDVFFSVEGMMPPPEAIPGRPPPAYAPPRPRRPTWLLWTLGGAAVVVLALVVLAVLGYFFVQRAPAIGPGPSVAGESPPPPGPDVALMEPEPGASVSLGESVMVFATARDEQGVVRTELWADGQLVTQQGSPDPAGVTPLSLVYNWQATTPGTHSLIVRAYNSRGAVGESPVFYIDVSGEQAQEPGTALYVVQPGDTLDDLAHDLGTTPGAIQQENPGMGDAITDGQIIAVPMPPPPPLPPQPPSQPQAPGPTPTLVIGRIAEPAPGQPSALQPPSQPQAPGPTPSPTSGMGAIVGPAPGPTSGMGAIVGPAPGPNPAMGAIAGQTPGPPPGMASLKEPAPQGIPQNPNPTNLKAVTAGCKSVTLTWDDNSTNEKGFFIYRRQYGSGGGKGKQVATLGEHTGKQMTYVDKTVPGPGGYVYRVEALVEGNYAPSNDSTVFIPVSETCVADAMYKHVNFYPVSLNVTGKDSGSWQYVSCKVSFGPGSYRRIPLDSPSTLSPGNWTSVGWLIFPPPASVYLENKSDSTLNYHICCDARKTADGVPYPMGCVNEVRPISELTSEKGWYTDKAAYGVAGYPGGFEIFHHLWIDDVKWVGRWTNSKIKAPYLRAPTKDEAGTKEMKAKISQCKTTQCDARTTRALVWDWQVDKKTADQLESFIFYRLYSCPGEDAKLAAPQVVQPTERGVLIPARAEFPGCAVRYQVSAYGSFGESPLSNALDLVETPPIVRLRVTFKTLEARLKGNSVYVNPVFLANHYKRGTSGEYYTLKSGTQDLSKLLLSGKTGNNFVLVDLAEGDSLQIGFTLKGKTSEFHFFSWPAGKSWQDFPRTTDIIELKDGDDSYKLTVEIGAEGKVAAEDVRLSADIGVQQLRWCGQNLCVLVYNLGPDSITSAELALKWVWRKYEAPHQPGYSYTVHRWVSLPPDGSQWVKLMSTKDPSWPMPALPVIMDITVTPLESSNVKYPRFDDPDPSNNTGWISIDKAGNTSFAQPSGVGPPQQPAQPTEQPVKPPPAQATEQPIQPPTQPHPQGKSVTRFENKTPYDIISLQIDGKERFQPGYGIPADGGAYDVELTAGIHTFQATNGGWSGNTPQPMYYWPDRNKAAKFTQANGKIGTITIEGPAIEQFLTCFGRNPCWTAMHIGSVGYENIYQRFCFDANKGYKFYWGQQGQLSQIGAGTYKLKAYTTTAVTFSVTDSQDGKSYEGLYYETNGYFDMMNGPNGAAMRYTPDDKRCFNP
jgi:LysM repeat protein